MIVSGLVFIALLPVSLLRTQDVNVFDQTRSEEPFFLQLQACGVTTSLIRLIFDYFSVQTPSRCNCPRPST